MELIYTILEGDTEVVRELLEDRADIDTIDKWGFGAIQEAAWLGHTETLRELILWI